MPSTSKDVRSQTLAAHGHLLEVLKRRGKWEAYLPGDPFPVAAKPMNTRKELVAFLRSRAGRRAILVEERTLEVPLPLGSNP
jgi:hypothetical protein